MHNARSTPPSTSEIMYLILEELRALRIEVSELRKEPKTTNPPPEPLELPVIKRQVNDIHKLLFKSQIKKRTSKTEELEAAVAKAEAQIMIGSAKKADKSLKK
jgi:hypothetical protein